MKTVVVASQNPVKAKATLAGFERMFPGTEFRLEAVATTSGVGHQPRSGEETLRGATTRARSARATWPDADFWVGIEGGVEEGGDGMQAFAWVVVLSDGGVGRGRTGTFLLPEPVADLVRQGKELGEADDLFFGRQNSKQREGAIGILTGNVVDRKQLYEHAVVLALVPFKNQAIYPAGT